MSPLWVPLGGVYLLSNNIEQVNPKTFPQPQPQPQTVKLKVKKQHGCIFTTVFILFLLIVFCFLIGIASANEKSIPSDTEWGKQLQEVLYKAEIDNIDSVEPYVILRDVSYKEKNGSAARRDYPDDEIATRWAIIKTKRGVKIKSLWGVSDVDRLEDFEGSKVVYYEKPDAANKYSYDVVSYKTGELIHPADPDKAAKIKKLEEAAKAKASKPIDNGKDNFIQDMKKWYNYEKSDAEAIYDLLSSLGCSGVQVLGGSMTSGTGIDAMRGTVNGHQINFTAENKKVFYVQITGWARTDYGWYLNWRGKIKYGLHDNKLAFDLYDDTAGGNLAYYNRSEDAVVPWSEK